MHIDHINISTPAGLLVRVRDFYCDVLGLSEGFRPKLSKNGFWLYAEGKPIIHLVESLEHFPSEKPGFLDHFALKTTDATSIREKLDAAGTEYTTNHLPDIGVTQIFCKDPAGIRVELNFLNEPLSAD